MAEEFLEEIYDEAYVLELLQEYIEQSNTSRLWDDRKTYNNAAAIMERIITRWAEKDVDAALALQNTALEIQEHIEDRRRVNGLIRRGLIPQLFDYMSNFTGIMVDTGRYILESADSGFLTIKDKETDRYLHDIHDPMREAAEIAASIYSPNMDSFLILGCGLGYLAYQLWKRSDETTEIVIFEDDKEMLEYAEKYGVLSWIKEDKLKIVYNAEPDQLLQTFLAYIKQADSDKGFEVCDWKKRKYIDLKNRDFINLFGNQELSRTLHFRPAINYRMNMKQRWCSFKEIKERFSFNEWITVAAGPSLDEQLDFIRESKGKRGIIAVNTVLRRILNEGIIPDIVAAADQDNVMLRHIEGIVLPEDIPLIASRFVNWRYVEQYEGTKCFIDIGGGTQNCTVNGNDMERWEIGGTVASLAIEAAIRMSPAKIFLAGQDLGFPMGKNYAKGMPHEITEQSVGNERVISVDGSMIETTAGYNVFRLAIEQQISNNTDIEFFNLSKHGALIKGTKNI